MVSIAASTAMIVHATNPKHKYFNDKKDLSKFFFLMVGMYVTIPYYVCRYITATAGKNLLSIKVKPNKNVINIINIII